jgi:3'-5' exoribonuclease 1
MQADVDGAPTWLQVMVDFERFLVKHELYDPKSKAIDTKLVWCCDGPWDLKEFFA